VAQLALALPSGAAEQMLDYVDLMAKWNRTYNLTAVRDPGEMIGLHVLDSLSVLPHLPMPGAHPSLADVGSGAGLPGIPLALARPDWRVVLVESSQKKAAFLRQAAMQLELSNVEVHEGRAERWRPAEGHQVVISRAFAELGEFLAECRHLVAPTGVLAAMKGRLGSDELSALPKGCQCSQPIALKVPLVDAERTLVLCRASS
jgi:16S rRNA (guanine527-N7)-methyltransferase